MEGLTLGEKRLRRKSNTSLGEPADSILRLSADLIDLCEQHKDKEPRLAALAQTHYEEASMWAMKLVTTERS